MAQKIPKVSSPRKKKSGPGLVADISFERIADRVPAMIGVYDFNSGKYIYANKAVTKLLGYTPKELTTKGIKFVNSLVHPEDFPKIMEKNQKALKKAHQAKPGKNGHEPIVNFEYRMRHKKGHWVWLHTDGSIYDRTADGHVSRIMNISIDITERKETENKLREITTQLEHQVKEGSDQLGLALEASQMGIWEVDLISGELNWPPQSLQLLGLKPTDKITFERFVELVHPEDRQLIKESSEKALRNEKAGLIEHRVIWPDGSIHWFLTQGEAIFKNNRPIKIIGAAINIDDLKATQAALDASEQRYHAFISNSNEGIWRFELDKPLSIGLEISKQIKHMYKYAYLAEANDAMAEMYGEPSSESLVGRRLGELLIESDKQNTEYLTAFIKAGYRLSGVESHELDSAGLSKYFRNSLVGTIEDGQLIRAWGTQQDVTEQHQAMEALKRSEERLKSMVDQQAALVELNDAKDEFISLASHQLRTPATGVKQFIGMLLENYFGELTEDQRTMLEYAYESNERQLEVINDLLKVAQVDAGKVVLAKQKCDLADMLEDIMQEQRTQFARRKQRVLLDRPKEPVKASVDAGRMRMVVENLIDNASKYTSEGKRITVSINRSASGKHITIKVKDEGVGIASEDISRLFQKFSRLENPLSIQVGGTGIGLYWAKKIVDLHGGSISVKSKPGQGSTFIVRIPA